MARWVTTFNGCMHALTATQQDAMDIPAETLQAHQFIIGTRGVGAVKQEKKGRAQIATTYCMSRMSNISVSFLCDRSRCASF